MVFLLEVRVLDPCFFFFFFNDTATTEIYTLSLHDALPISERAREGASGDHRENDRNDEDHEAGHQEDPVVDANVLARRRAGVRSEEHTSELQSPDHLVCRLLLEKKKKNTASESTEVNTSTE